MRPKLPLAFPLPATPWPVAYATKVKHSVRDFCPCKNKWLRMSEIRRKMAA